MEPTEKDIDPQVTEPEAPAPETPAPATPAAEAPAQPAAEEPITDDLISHELAPKLTVEDAEPPVPVAPDLDAVQPDLPSTSGMATNLDLPSLELQGNFALPMDEIRQRWTAPIPAAMHA